MRRRDLLSLIGTSVAAWPVMARAQQPEQMRRIGVLMNISRERSAISGPGRSFSARIAGAGLDTRRQRAD